MPNGDILDFLKAFQGQPQVGGIDLVGAAREHRTVGEFLHPAHGTVGLLPRHVEENPASLVRSPQLAQSLDLRQGQFQGREERRSPHL